MTKHQVILTPSESNSELNAQRLIVAGCRGYGFGLGHVAEGEAARQETGGEMVPGPWAYAYGLCGVIDNYGGTATEVERQRAAGQLIEAAIGDILTIYGRDYRIEAIRYDNHNVNLVPVK